MIDIDPEMVGLLLGGGVFGTLLNRLFDWRVNKKAAKKLEADTEKTARETKKIDIDAAQVIAATAVELVAPLKAELADLRGRVGLLEDENAKTMSKLQMAINHIRELLIFIRNHIPDKTPPTAPADLGI